MVLGDELKHADEVETNDIFEGMFKVSPPLNNPIREIADAVRTALANESEQGELVALSLTNEASVLTLKVTLSHGTVGNIIAEAFKVLADT